MTTNTTLPRREHFAAALDSAIATSGCSTTEAARRAGMNRTTLSRKRSGASTLYVHDVFALAAAGVVSPDGVLADAQRLAGQ